MSENFDFTNDQFKGVENFGRLFGKEILKIDILDQSSEHRIVTFTSIDKTQYEVKYKLLTEDKLCSLLSNTNDSIDITGYYINFDMKDHFDKSSSKFILNAQYNFWDIPLDLSNLKFDNCDINFDYSFFNGEVNFEKSIFTGDKIYIRCSHLYKTSFFCGAKFDLQKLSFFETIWGKRTNEKIISFNGVNFFNTSVSFYKSDFADQEVTFEGTYIENGSISFRMLNSTNLIKFYESDLGFKELSFECSKINKLQFDSIIFKMHVNLRVHKIKELSIDNCTIEKSFKMDLKNIPVQNENTKEKNLIEYIAYDKISFYKTINLGQIFVDFRKNNLRAALKENNGRKENLKAEQFRMLKENFRTIGYYEDEDLAYVEYMKHMLKSYNRFSKKYLFNKIMGALGKYGTSPSRILFSCIATILFFALVYYYPINHLYELNAQELIDNLQSETINSSQIDIINDSIYFSGITFLTIGYGDITPSGFNQNFQVISIIEGFIGLVLMSYLTVSIVRKILR